MRGLLKLLMILVPAAVGLTACNMFEPRADPSRFFTLTAISEPKATAPAGSKHLDGETLGLGPVRLPGYLDRQEIVTRVSPNRIGVSENDRWAEPLEDNFTRVMGQNLAVLLHTDRFLVYPWPPSRRPNYQVAIEVLRFESNSQGEVLLSARWEILDTEKRTPLLSEESAITHQASGRSTDTAVAALSDAVADLSREIANAFQVVTARAK